MMEQAAERMSPVHSPRIVSILGHPLAMFLPELVGKQKSDNQQWHDQKRA
jgi:hypothetical protein